MTHVERLALIHRPFIIRYMGGSGSYPWGGVQVGLSIGLYDISRGRRASSMAVLSTRGDFDGSWDNIIEREEEAA